MDPIAHTMTGAALAASGLRRATPLATATLIMAANAPDIDILAYFTGNEYVALAFRRGWTHGILALAVWPFFLTALVLIWDRGVRRRRRPAAEPARGRALLPLAALGVLTHPTLDWLNNYGLRWLMPLEGRWFYGDALFIVDPWVWLVLGGALFLAYSRTRLALGAWLVFAAAATVLLLGSGMVPPLARALWVAGLVLIAVLRWRGGPAPGPAHGQAPACGHGRQAPARTERYARWAVLGVAVYMIIMVAADRAARQHVRGALAAAGIGPIEAVMVAPAPANPFAGHVVAATPTAYRSADFHWLRSPRLRIHEDSLPAGRPDPAAEAAATTADARNYLVWARFPFFLVEERADGFVVRIGDARYADLAGAGSLRGLTVELDRDLRPLSRQGAQRSAR